MAEELVAEFLRDLRADSYSYDDLARVARRWIEFVEREFEQPSPNAADGHLDRLARFYSRRRFALFRSRLLVRSPLEGALLELFLLARIRTYVLAYLSVQEGENFEGADHYETRVPVFISQLLRHLGKRSHFSFRPGIGWFRLRVDVDPLMHLRKMYAVVLRAERQGKGRLRDRIAIAWHRTCFRLKTRLAGIATRFVFGKVMRSNRAAGIADLFRSRLTRRLLATVIFILFPEAAALTEAEWVHLLSRIEEHFAPRLADLLDAMPADSIENHGLIKLVKVAFGTIAGRTAVRAVHEPDAVEFIFNTLRLAYSWGVTYPLVDNVLDSAETTPAVRGQLVGVLRELFAGRDPGNLPDEHAGVREVRRRLAEALSLVPADRVDSARRALGHLLESHRRDSHRRLSALATTVDDVERVDVLVDTALKAALVRLATMEICGIVVDEATLARNLVRSLFNQLGDDLWDIYEDYADDRVTPYTLHLTRGGRHDPFDLYFQYSVLLARGMSRRRRTAMFMGFCETLRDSLLAIERRGDDRLGVADAIARTLRGAGGGAVSAQVGAVPHVDFDAVLFAFETALLKLTGSKNGVKVP